MRLMRHNYFDVPGILSASNPPAELRETVAMEPEPSLTPVGVRNAVKDGGAAYKVLHVSVQT